MKIEDVINRAVVIDDSKVEGEAIVETLQKVDVPVDFIHIEGSEDNISEFIHPRELIFADLLLDGNSEKVVTNISRLIGIIKKIQPENAKYYGIVLWTKHKDYFEEFLKRIGKIATENLGARQETIDDEEEIEILANLNVPPLFVLCMDKTKYILEDTWNFDSLLDDINSELQKSRIAYFSLAWRKLVNNSIENVLSSIYSLSANFDNHEECLSYILSEVSRNEIGEKGDVNLTSGIYQAFDSLLNSELLSIAKEETLPNLTGIDTNPFGDDVSVLQELSARLNARFFIESNSLNKNEVLPGNVYQILDTNSALIVPEDEVVKAPVYQENGKYKCEKTYPRVNVAIELTPPCDHSNKKIHSRFVGGYVFDIPLGKYKIEKKDIIYRFNKSERCYSLYPILLPKEDHIKCIVFDFRCLWTLPEEEIKNDEKYKLWFKAKPNLFADILQKFSSHASRLGLNDIHLECL